MTVTVCQGAFSATEEYDRLMAEGVAGAVVTFTGYVRDFADTGPVETLELEHYPGMAERVLSELGATAERRFSLRAWRITHRFGTLAAGEPIVWVGALADHRQSAFDACEFLMDTLKTDAPFWKREHAGGQSSWVAARSTDDKRRKRWDTQA